MLDRERQNAECDANFEAFEKMLPDIMPQHEGEYAFMQDKKIIAYFKSFREAVTHWKTNHPDEYASV